MAIKKGKKRYTVSLTEIKMEKLKETAALFGGFTTYSAIFEAFLDDLISSIQLHNKGSKENEL